MLTSLILLGLPPVLQVRDTKPLTAWEYVLAPQRQSMPPESGWKPAVVPKLLEMPPSGERFCIWYRSRVTLPTPKPGQRFFLQVPGALYAPKVYLDGKKVGETLDGWNPLRVEVTEGIRSGRQHTLLIQCQSDAAIMADGFLPQRPGDDDLRGKVIAPIGGYRAQQGLWEAVSLTSTPSSRIVDEEVIVTPSVRKRSLTVAGRTDAIDGGKVSVDVIDAKGAVVQSGAGSLLDDGSWRVTFAFPKARLWSPEDPYLYRVRLRLVDRSALPRDEVALRFGFKEVWTDGPDFVLNGVRRHILATSTWPSLLSYTRDEIRAKVRNAKATGANAFRFHIGPWSRVFLEVADEEGLMTIPEAPVYTDGSGVYAYKDPRFWANYRDHLAGMVKRDRNHASVILWSLGNEILFMGNTKFDADLPKKLGDIGRFVKSIDPSHPTTFEADLDPDGAFDVIGLHYPHEMPDQHAYPAIVDWLGTGKLTEAAGGMLGNTRSQFTWERKKPLYIGEYLWVPQGDFSPGTVFFGDEAYRNRGRMNTAARARSWIDQTIGYRRAGVSGLSPWTAMDFGMSPGNPVEVKAQRFAYKRVAAYLREYSRRAYAGQTKSLSFDVFNDQPRAAGLTLRLTDHSSGRPMATKSFRLPPAGRTSASLPITFPKTPGRFVMDYALVDANRTVDSGRFIYSIAPESPQIVAPGRKVVTYRAGDDLRMVSGLEPSKTVLLIEPHAIDLKVPKGAEGLPLIGAGGFDTRRFLQFVAEGGRAVVLEQNDLAPTGMGVGLSDYPSTMAFALNPLGNVQRGLDADGLKFWGDDMYVSRRQIVRTGRGGMRGLAVTGGARGLVHSPITTKPYGKGCVVFVQMETGKRRLDPAAQRTIQNAVNIAATAKPQRAGKVYVVGALAALASTVRNMGLEAESVTGALTTDQVKNSAGIVLVGGGSDVVASRPALAEAVRAGKPIVWRLPTPGAFAALRDVLRADSTLRLETARNAATLRDRQSPLLEGIAREDLTLTSPPQGWDRQIEMRAGTVVARLVPAGAQGGGQTIGLKQIQTTVEKTVRTADAVTFDRKGTFSFPVTVPKTGFYSLRINASARQVGDRPPLLEVRVDGDRRDFLLVEKGRPALETWVELSKGTRTIEVDMSNMPSWGGGTLLSIHSIEVGGTAAYPDGVQVAVMPGALASWQAGTATIVLDGFAWNADPQNVDKGIRYAGALFANLGLPFRLEVPSFAQSIPTARFQVESGPYNEANANGVVLRSNGSASTEFYVTQSGDYDLSVTAESTTVDGVFGRFEVEVDGKVLTTLSALRETPAVVSGGKHRLTEGRHTLRLRFVNDASNATEDRNLTINRIELAPAAP